MAEAALAHERGKVAAIRALLVAMPQSPGDQQTVQAEDFTTSRDARRLTFDEG